jgi:hypothetical protein
MDSDKKIKMILLLALIVLTSAVLLAQYYQTSEEKVDILYFRNDRCTLIRNTDNMIAEAEKRFGYRVNITTMNVSLYPDDPKDSEEVRQLREKYNVIGLPEIVINGQKMTTEFTGTNLFSEICNNLRTKPLVCL